ncbi:MAG: copper chaperone PCu(A)C [Bauldia sp.]
MAADASALGRGRGLAIAGAGLLSLLAAGVGVWFAFFAAPPFHAAYRLGPLEIATPWARATPPGTTVGGGYLAVRNTGAESDRLLGGTAAIAPRLDMHTMIHRGSIMEMRAAPTGLEVPPGGVLTLDPHGGHIMFVGLTVPLKEGDKVPVRLSFEKAGTIDVEFVVAGIAADGPEDTGKR